jgi:hypothetical protein
LAQPFSFVTKTSFAQAIQPKYATAATLSSLDTDSSV